MADRSYVLRYAVQHGDSAACAKFGVSDRTLRRWRAASKVSPVPAVVPLEVNEHTSSSIGSQKILPSSIAVSDGAGLQRASVIPALDAVADGIQEWRDPISHRREVLPAGTRARDWFDSRKPVTSAIPVLPVVSVPVASVPPVSGQFVRSFERDSVRSSSASFASTVSVKHNTNSIAMRDVNGFARSRLDCVPPPWVWIVVVPVLCYLLIFAGVQ